MRGLRKDKSAEALLRTLLIGCGHSLRETVVCARQAEIADLSDVALLKRLRKSREWLYALCMALFQEQGIAVSDMAHQMRAFDATVVSEPGKTGSQWRLDYSVTLPSFGCDFFKLTPTKGRGSAESFKHFPVHPGDYLLADRGYSTAVGIEYVANAGGYVTVRVNTGALHFEKEPGVAFNLLSAVESITRTGEIGQWCVNVKTNTGPGISGRICVLRKTEEATQMALKRIDQNAQRKKRQPLNATRCFAGYVIVFTTFPADRFSASDVLEGYRLRWQIELVFKRFKSLAQFGVICQNPTKRVQRRGFMESSSLRSSQKKSIVTHELFPPGATGYQHSPWKDFRFALNEVIRAIEPVCGLTTMIQQWTSISDGLKEPSRKRTVQIENYFDTKTSWRLWVVKGR